jgi:hypothetical protein
VMPWDKWGNLSTCACGRFRLGEHVDLGFRIVEEKVMTYEVVLGIKRWFDEIFDGYLV